MGLSRSSSEAFRPQTITATAGRSCATRAAQRVRKANATFSLSIDLLDELEAWADERGEKKSAVVEQALRLYMASM